MPLDKLIQSIEKEAQDASDKIIREANENAKKIIDVAELSANKNSEALKNSIVTNCEKENALANSTANLLNKNRILEFRQKWIDRVFDNTLDELQKLDNSVYENWVSNKILELCTTGNETILFTKKDLNIFNKNWLRKVNTKLKNKGTAGNLKISYTESELKGGFIIQTTKFEIVVTFEEVLHRLRQKAQSQIDNILFNKNSDNKNK